MVAAMRAAAASSAATTAAAVVSEAISHDAATRCTQEPRLDTRAAIHTARNTGIRRGCPRGRAVRSAYRRAVEDYHQSPLTARVPR